jgi:transcriptional regulator with XRE-family HTH domain
LKPAKKKQKGGRRASGRKLRTGRTAGGKARKGPNGLALPAGQNSGPPASITSRLAKIGEAIRTLRRQRGLTLSDVASAAGLSVAFLSQIERGLAVPSLLSVYSLSDALSISARYFLGGEDTKFAVFRASQRSGAVPARGEPRVARLSMERPQQKINMATVTLNPGYDSGTISHAGEKVIFVVSGRVEITLDEETFRLGPSDSTHFRATLVHRVRNTGATAATLLCSSNILLSHGLS